MKSFAVNPDGRNSEKGRAPQAAASDILSDQENSCEQEMKILV